MLVGEHGMVASKACLWHLLLIAWSSPYGSAPHAVLMAAVLMHGCYGGARSEDDHIQ